jgi:Ribonucleotide reductase, small chain/SCP-2 sterol transfer family
MATAATAVDRVSYEDLYKRWEKGNWSATEIDFSEDRDEWNNKWSDLQRRAALWNYSLFFHGEDSVTDNLSPYIDAAPKEEQKYFLATQQVDEARHSIFFGRFMREVVQRGDSDIASALEATEGELTWGFRKTFERLDRVADNLRRDKSLPNLAASIVMYHVLVEATLAQPGQHFIDGYLNANNWLPGFRSGMANVALDEQRHIGFGVKMLADLCREDPECKDAVADLLRDAIPEMVAVFVPPNWDLDYVRVFDFEIEDIYKEGMQSLETKLRTAGIPLEELPGPMPIPLDKTPEERARQGIALLRAGIVGEKNGPPSRDPEVIEMLFGLVQRSVDPRATPDRPVTIQWDFTDVEPWYLRVNNGSTEARSGQADNADVTFKCSWENWVDVAGGRTDPRVAMLTGKVKPKGSLKALWQTSRFLGG